MRLIVRDATETIIIAATNRVVRRIDFVRMENSGRHEMGAQEVRPVLEIRIVLQQRSRDSANVWRRHAAPTLVHVAIRRSCLRGRDDRARRDEIGLHAAVASRTAAAGAGQLSNRV